MHLLFEKVFCHYNLCSISTNQHKEKFTFSIVIRIFFKVDFHSSWYRNINVNIYQILFSFHFDIIVIYSKIQLLSGHRATSSGQSDLRKELQQIFDYWIWPFRISFKCFGSDLYKNTKTWSLPPKRICLQFKSFSLVVYVMVHCVFLFSFSLTFQLTYSHCLFWRYLPMRVRRKYLRYERYIKQKKF